MLVFYEAPHRLKETLKDAREALGNRRCVVARELTKLYEQFIRGTLDEVREAIEQGEARGEIVLLVGPPLEDATELVNQAASGSIAAAVAALIDDEGLDHKAALKRVARARHLSKSEAYRRLMAERAAEEIAPDDVE
jgi:16S rRNA (cytidine1402-2'-O)-methyltransferase